MSARSGRGDPIMRVGADMRTWHRTCFLASWVNFEKWRQSRQKQNHFESSRSFSACRNHGRLRQRTLWGSSPICPPAAANEHDQHQPDKGAPSHPKQKQPPRRTPVAPRRYRNHHTLPHPRESNSATRRTRIVQSSHSHNPRVSKRNLRYRDRQRVANNTKDSSSIRQQLIFPIC